MLAAGFRSFNNQLISWYKLYVDKMMGAMSPGSEKSTRYWRNKLFAKVLVISLPISLLAVIPSIIIELQSGYLSLVFLDILIEASFFFLVLNRNLSLQVRKVSIIIIVSLFAIVLLTVLGSFGMACIYFFSLSIITALFYPGRLAYAGVIINLFIFAGFSLIIYFGLFNLPILATMPLYRWVLYSLNFLFVDLVLVALISQLLTGLERTIAKESLLYNWLQKELLLKEEANHLLIQSQEHYKTLLSESPLSICIYDMDTLRFLQVNEAASRIYDYTEKEFMDIGFAHLQSQEAPENNGEMIFKEINSYSLPDHEIALHAKKDGQPIYVEIKSSDYVFEGKQAKLVIAADITQKVDHIKAIKKQNEKFKEIAFMQSHVIRVPLANIMGISNLIMEDITSEAQRDLFNYLDISVKQLDDVIRDIVNHKE